MSATPSLVGLHGKEKACCSVVICGLRPTLVSSGTRGTRNAGARSRQDCRSDKEYTKVTFWPDFSRFGMTSLDPAGTGSF